MKDRVRNCKDIGINLQRIMQRLMSNDDLVKLLYYTCLLYTSPSPRD